MPPIVWGGEETERTGDIIRDAGTRAVCTMPGTVGNNPAPEIVCNILEGIDGGRTEIASQRVESQCSMHRLQLCDAAVGSRIQRHINKLLLPVKERDREEINFVCGPAIPGPVQKPPTGYIISCFESVPTPCLPLHDELNGRAVCRWQHCHSRQGICGRNRQPGSGTLDRTARIADNYGVAAGHIGSDILKQ